VPIKMGLSDFLTYCLARYGMGVDPRTCKDEAFLRSLASPSRGRWRLGGSTTRESGSLASTSASFTGTHSEQMVEAILCNALHCHLRSPHCGQPWARARFSLPTSPLCLLHSLGETGIGLLKVEKGSRPESGRGRRTSFAASQQLIGMAGNVTLDDIGRGPGERADCLEAAPQPTG
jgi:hypothetical protein